MIRYVPTSGAMTADTLSDALWALSRPNEVRLPQDTQRLFGVVTMKDGSVWLQVDTEFSISVHPTAELGAIASILQPWIDDKLLPADSLTQLQAYIESVRGGRMIPWQAFPQLFKDQSKTHAELVKLGLIPVQK